MPFSILVLYSRKGCCLCEGLESRLRSLPLDQLTPPIELTVIDIDEKSTPNSVRVLYDLKVPVLALRKKTNLEEFPLPRVSPRLKGEALALWLQGACMKVIGMN